MSRYVLGVDGGGTKTDAAIATEDGTVVGFASGTGSNWESAGIEHALSVLESVILDACNQAGIATRDLEASTLAVAGIDWPDDIKKYHSISDHLQLRECQFINDSFAALAAGSPHGEGIISIAGTGGKTSGINNNLRIQTMGMELGEGGGAGQLVSEALSYIASEFHGSVEPSILSQLIPASVGYSDLNNFFEAIARKGLKIEASFAPVIFDYATTGDPGAIIAVQKTAQQHALDVIGIARKLDFFDKNCTVVRAGGLHTANHPLFNSTFHDIVNKELPMTDICTLSQPPVLGAVVLSNIRAKRVNA